MKKSLFVALSAIFALTLVGCDPETNPEPEKAQVSIKQGESVIIGKDKTKQLEAIVKPAGTKVTWESSDPTIVTVDKIGVITGVEIGEATITASAGDAKATCVVTVTDDADIIEFELNDYGLFGSEPNMIAGSERWVHLVSGDSLYCQLGTLYLRVWDNGQTYVSGKGFSGEGFHIIAEVPVYWVLEGEDAGKWIGSSSGFYIDTLGTRPYKPYTCKAADVDVQMYGDFWKQYMAYAQDTTNNPKPDGNLYTNSQSGTNIVYYWPAENNATSWNMANVRYMNVLKEKNDAGEQELKYTIKVEWYNRSNEYWYGLKVTTEEKDGKNYITGLVEPYDFKTLDMEYGNMPVEEEPTEVYFIGDQSRLHLGEMPIINRNMDNMHMYHE